MNGVALNTRTDEAVMEIPQFDFEVEAVIHCAPHSPYSEVLYDLTISFPCY